VSELRDQIRAEQPTWERDLTAAAQKLIEEHFEVQPLMEQLQVLRETQASLTNNIDELVAKSVSQITGRARDDLPSREHARRTDRYISNNDDDKGFARYPAGVRFTIRKHCEQMTLLLMNAHPIGRRIKDLQDQSDTFQDNIAACGSHTQLQEIWSEVKGALDIIELDAFETREKRKIDLTRADRKKEAAKKGKA